MLNEFFKLVPEGFRYIAMDKDGDWYAHMFQPSIIGNQWRTGLRSPAGSAWDWVKVHIPYTAPDWEKSLMERPVIMYDESIIHENAPQNAKYYASSIHGASYFTELPVYNYISKVWFGEIAKESKNFLPHIPYEHTFRKIGEIQTEEDRVFAQSFRGPTW